MFCAANVEYNLTGKYDNSAEATDFLRKTIFIKSKLIPRIIHEEYEVDADKHNHEIVN